jgi:hypothetical protein
MNMSGAGGFLYFLLKKMRTFIYLKHKREYSSCFVRCVNMEGYCVKCKKKVEIKDGKEVVNAKNRRMMKGKCPNCSTTVCRILGNK